MKFFFNGFLDTMLWYSKFRLYIFNNCIHKVDVDWDPSQIILINAMYLKHKQRLNMYLIRTNRSNTLKFFNSFDYLYVYEKQIVDYKDGFSTLSDDIPENPSL